MNNLVGAEDMSVEQIYMQSCLVCHGDDGSGNMPGVPDLADSKTFLLEKDAVMLERIRSGIQSAGGLSMPARGGNPDLTDEQLLNLLHYMKDFLEE